MKKHFIFTFYFFALIFTSCDKADDKLIIINSTNRALFLSDSRFDSIEGESPFEAYMKITDKDTLWLKDNENFIKPYGELKLSAINTTWESAIERHYTDQYLKIFIFDADTLKKYNWNKIKSDSRYYKKIKLNLDQLEKMNWHIILK